MWMKEHEFYHYRILFENDNINAHTIVIKHLFLMYVKQNETNYDFSYPAIQAYMQTKRWMQTSWKKLWKIY